MLRKWLVVLVSALELSALASVRTEVLADGWMFRLEGESEERPVRVPHDWGIEKGFLKAGSCSAQGDLPFVGKSFYRCPFDGFTPPEGGRTYLTFEGCKR